VGNSTSNIMLSIITVTRNNEAGLRRTLSTMPKCIDSSTEWIIVDGMSSDGTAKLLRESIETLPLPMLHIQEHDDGIYDAMNKGLNGASGEWVTFLNAGDRLSPMLDYSSLMNTLSSGTAHDWIMLNGAWEDADGRTTPARLALSYRRILATTGLRPILHQAVIYRRKDLLALGGYEHMEFCSDQYVNLEFIKNGPPLLIDRDFVTCEPGGLSMTKDFGIFARHLSAYRRELNMNIGGNCFTDRLALYFTLAIGRILIRMQIRAPRVLR
jgi:glycosyltransferase involved in cell wall biosynthesis